jgi:hypothetical protein
MSDDSTATLLTFLYRLNSAFSRATISGGAWYKVFPSPEKETLVWDVLSDNDEFTAGSMARLVAYDIVKYCPSSRLDVWERVFVGIQRDFTRADHPDHTVAALSTLSVLPVRMFLQFLCTANVESTMIGLVQNEACKFIRLTSIEALGDLLLRACAKLSAEDGDALKSRSYESISEEKRTRHAIFDRVLLVWKQIARSAEDDDIAIAAASFRAINRLFREGYQASLTAVDDEFGLNAVGVRDRLLGNCNRSNTNGKSVPSPLFEFIKRFINATAPRVHILIARARTIPHIYSSPALEAVTYLLLHLLDNGIQVRVDEPPRYESPVVLSITWVDTVLLNVLHAMAAPSLMFSAGLAVWRLSHVTLLDRFRPNWLSIVVSCFMQIMQRKSGYPFGTVIQKFSGDSIRTQSVPNKVSVVNVIVSSLYWVQRELHYPLFPFALRAVAGIEEVALRLAYFQHIADLVLYHNVNYDNMYEEGDSVRARLRCSLTCIFESDAWMAELMSIAVSVPSAKHLFSAYARCLSPGLNPLRCREEIAMTFLLAWTNTYYRMFADASQTPSAEGVSAAWSLLEHFRCVLEWPAAPIEKLETGVKGEASTSVHTHGSPTAHLYVDILELILPQISLLAEYTNLESTSMIIMEYALQLENIAAPTIRIRILSSLLRFWVSYRHESTTSLDVGAALTKGIHDEFEGFFGSQEIFSVKHSCRRKASTKRIDESSVERMLFLIPCLLVVLESQERDDCSVCASIRREVSKTIEYIQSVEDLGVKNTFLQHSFAKSILLQELKRLLHFGTKTFSRGSIPSIPGEAHLIFQCDKCFPEHVLGPEFEYYSAMQMHVFSHGGCQQEKKVRGFETDKPWKQALSLSGFMPTCIDSTIHLFGNEAKKREISKLITPTAFFATPISMQINQWNLGGQGYCSLNGPNDPVIVKMRHLFSPHTNEILIFSQLFSMMNFSPEVCMRLQLSVSMDGVMLPGNSKLEHTFDGPIGPCCVLQFDTVLKLRCFGTVTIIPLVSICDQRIATRSDKHQSTAGFPRNNVTTDSIGKLKFQSPCADVGAGGEMGKTTDHTATGIAACADKGPGGTSVSASPSGIALVQNHFEVELSSEESADGGFDDESSVNVNVFCKGYTIWSNQWISRAPKWIAECPGAYFRLWSRMGFSFFATATTPWEASRTRSVSHLLTSLASICRFSFRHVEIYPSNSGLDVGSFVGKTCQGHWLAFNVVATLETCKSTAFSAEDCSWDHYLPKGRCDTTQVGQSSTLSGTSYVRRNRNFLHFTQSANNRKMWTAEFEFRSNDEELLLRLHEKYSFPVFFRHLSDGMFKLTRKSTIVQRGDDYIETQLPSGERKNSRWCNVGVGNFHDDILSSTLGQGVDPTAVIKEYLKINRS